MKRRKLPPDNRLNWRDPEMPVLKLGIREGRKVLFEVDPETAHQWYVNKLNGYYPAPHYTNDPSYWWNRKKVLK